MSMKAITVTAFFSFLLLLASGCASQDSWSVTTNNPRVAVAAAAVAFAEAAGNTSQQQTGGQTGTSLQSQPAKVAYCYGVPTPGTPYNPGKYPNVVWGEKLPGTSANVYPAPGYQWRNGDPMDASVELIPPPSVTPVPTADISPSAIFLWAWNDTSGQGKLSFPADKVEMNPVFFPSDSYVDIEVDRSKIGGHQVSVLIRTEEGSSSKLIETSVSYAPTTYEPRVNQTMHPIERLYVFPVKVLKTEYEKEHNSPAAGRKTYLLEFRIDGEQLPSITKKLIVDFD